MPSIASRLVANPVPSGGAGAGDSSGLPYLPLANPSISPILRCPLPIMPTAATPDGLRQFQIGGKNPQYRFIPPAALTPSSAAPPSQTTTSSNKTLTTTASTFDIVAIAGATPNSSVTLTPTNAIAAAMTGVYVSGKAKGNITVTHPATAGGTFSVAATT